FLILFPRHLASLSPLPHGSGALSVKGECLALEGCPPGFTQDCTCPALLGMPLGVVRVILPGCHRLWRAVPGRFGLASYSHVAVPQPQRCKHPWFGLVPVRSPLLGGSRLLSLPPATEMFPFPGFASSTYCAPTRRSRKEVIQPQVPLRLPCYDFAPVTEFTLDGCVLAVRPPVSGAPGFHGVTGGVYKARERIHRGVADPRLLAIPA